MKQNNWIMGILALFVVFAFFGGYYIGTSEMSVSFEMDDNTQKSISDFSNTIENIDNCSNTYYELKNNLSLCQLNNYYLENDATTLSSRSYQEIVYFEDEPFFINMAFVFEGINIRETDFFIHKVVEQDSKGVK